MRVISLVCCYIVTRDQYWSIVVDSLSAVFQHCVLLEDLSARDLISIWSFCCSLPVPTIQKHNRTTYRQRQKKTYNILTPRIIDPFQRGNSEQWHRVIARQQWDECLLSKQQHKITLTVGHSGRRIKHVHSTQTQSPKHNGWNEISTTFVPAKESSRVRKFHLPGGGGVNNNNNNQICIAQVCRMTSEAIDGHLQSCYTARARPKCLTEEKCF